ncbi:MAG TPA: Bax inhibitor-1 family protein [Thermoanaerobaculia bacterium]|nr:Bax inhibitor-1 family protein [Thermoanaerobaculia bacterium]
MSTNLHNPHGIGLPTPIDVNTRAQFITRTYVHLLGAIVGFTLLEVYLFQSGLAASIAETLMGTSWLLVLGGFMIVGWLSSRVAATVDSLPAQYAALAAYVVAEAIIFVPLLYVAQSVAPGVIQSAAAVTLIGFAGLTAVVMITKRDFSFMRSFLLWGGVVALVLVVAGSLFGFQLGTYFSVAMIAFAGVAILYDTSNVLHHYPENRAVAAALQLFASVALMFWYVLRLFLSRD